MESTLRRLEKWYIKNCNQEWEHTYGIEISNIDNPGWSVKIDLRETVLENKEFKEISYQHKDGNDWLVCKKEGDKYIGFCGPEKLEELLIVFLQWAEKYA